MIAVLISMFGYAFVHSLLASRTFKQGVQARIGQRAYYGLFRLCYNIFAGITLLPISAVVLFQPGSAVWVMDGTVAIVASMLQVIGILITVIALMQIDLWRFLGLSQFSAYLNGEPLPLPPEPIQTGGLYGIVRHPLYLGSLLAIWPQLRMTEMMLAFNIAATLYFALGSWYEERRMLVTFGDEYATYRRKVPWLLPVRLGRDVGP